MPDTPISASPLARAEPWWRWINWLALDAVAVALTWLMVFAKMEGARLTAVNFGVLGAAVWLVYMTDRLLDGWSGAGEEGRHRFARRHARWLIPLMVVVALLTLWWMFHAMRWITVQAGLWLVGGVMAYLAMVLISRWKPVSLMLLTGVSGLIVMGLLQGNAVVSPGLQLWRAIAIGTLVTTLYFGLRQPLEPPPWTLVKKAVSGWLFALGVALGPYSHLQDWEGLLRGSPIILFAGACALNSIGIRLWENPQSTTAEHRLLNKLYPWCLAAVGLGAGLQAGPADDWLRPVLAGIAGCAAGFGCLHLIHKSLPTSAVAVLADLWMVAMGLLVLVLRNPG